VAEIEKIVLIYDGDSGLGAMVLDVLKKAMGREDCALCEITYSPIGKRRAWVACSARLGVPVEELHRDQLPESWGIGRADLPCIVGSGSDPRPRILLTAAEIAACAGSVEELERRLRKSMEPSD
jgi:hypothetical protein